MSETTHSPMTHSDAVARLMVGILTTFALALFVGCWYVWGFIPSFIGLVALLGVCAVWLAVKEVTWSIHRHQDLLLKRKEQRYTLDLAHYTLTNGGSVEQVHTDGRKIVLTSHLAYLPKAPGTVTINEAQQEALALPARLRPSQDSILAQLPYNQFAVSPGIHARTGQIVTVSLEDVPHVKFIGAPGFGKSCLAASVIDQVSQTNDSSHLQLALLDLEHKTSRLFENNDNIAQVRVGNRLVDLVATTADMVATQLGFLKREMTRRATLSEDELDRQPVLLMYVEEMLSLQYEVDPKLLDQMIADILILAVRARKYRMYLLSCMQTDYSTKDMKITQKMYRLRGAAAIDATAARAAGFQNTALVKENFASGEKGQFVIEYPGFSAIVLAADYDVKRRLQQMGATSHASSRVVDTTSQAVPDEEDKYVGNQDGKWAEVDLGILRVVREMVTNQRGVNEIAASAFPGMRNADAIAEVRRYLAYLVREAK